MPTSAVIPVLGYRDVREAVAWLRDAFGFAGRLRIGDHRAQLTLGGGDLVVAGLPAGARVLAAPTDHPYGERQYTAEDLGGYRWTFSQTIADVDPAAWGGALVE